MLPIETPSLFGDYRYPVFKSVMEEQQDKTWTAVEVPVSKDKHEYLSVLTEPQLRATTVTLHTFVEIEQAVGDLWMTIHNWYPHSEIEGMCMEFARMEKAVHAFFYQKMSDVLNVDPEDTKTQQDTVIELKNKLKLLKRITSNPDIDKPLTLATLAIIEQVLLFSNFALLKSFKANGNNLIKNTLLGVDYVIADENLHGVGAIGLHNTVLKESDIVDLSKHHTNVIAVMNEVITHEYSIVDYIFENQTSVNDITPIQLKSFICSRANNTLEQLGIEYRYPSEDSSIETWFYKENKSITIHDFFSTGTAQYSRTWSQEGFSILPHLEVLNGK